jgi:hypothetical protein
LNQESRTGGSTVVIRPYAEVQSTHITMNCLRPGARR